MRYRFVIVLAVVAALTRCSHYAPVSEEQLERDRRGDLLIDITLRHDLGFTERYVATYTVGRRVGHLLTSHRRERHVSLPLAKVDELHAIATTTISYDAYLLRLHELYCRRACTQRRSHLFWLDD